MENRRFLDLDSICENLTQAFVIDVLESLIVLRNNLDESRTTLSVNAMGEYVNLIMDLNEQIEVADVNINTLKIALLYFESKQFEKRLALGDHQNFCLN